jgi:hypothetical protein
MLQGTVQTFLVCLPTASGGGVLPCVGDTAPTAVTGTLVDAASAPYLSQIGQVDYVVASYYWGLSFVAVIAVWGTTMIFKWTKKMINLR